MPAPADPIAAVTHRDPYGYYEALLAREPIHREPRLGFWVAARADAVTDVLSNALCRVRPPAEPVPAALLGSAAADIFRHLVRMNDGARHCPLKDVISGTLQSLDGALIASEADRWALQLVERSVAPADGRGVDEFACTLPVRAIGSLLGVPEDRLAEVAQWTGAFVAGIGPAACGEQIGRAGVAAGELLRLFRAIAAGSDGGHLLARLMQAGERPGPLATDAIIANGVGLRGMASCAPVCGASRGVCTTSFSRSGAMIRRCTTRAGSWPTMASSRASR